ncbi:MAG: citrate/2-methylcitrate synthase [Pseudomonadota bacterium]|nr:citrate/2-methylcitrate synthase [Pseudomonadota bacterium]
MTRLTHKGLAGIEADDTCLSLVDGTAGVLSYRGYAVEDLLDLPFESVVWLLLVGELPSDVEARAFIEWFAEIGSLSSADAERVDTLRRAAHHPMDALQAALPVLDRSGADAPLPDFGEHVALRLAVRTRCVVAQLARAEAAPVASSAPLHWQRFLEEIGQCTPTEQATRAFATTQILQLDHGFNAGTFAARVVASTRAGAPAALSAAAGALSGVLHGGADQAALADAREAGSPERAAAFVDACLAGGRRVMGMGHREYRVRDPRARIVHALAREIAAGTELEQPLGTLEAMERRFEAVMAARGKALHANLEFYKSIVYLACGIPEDCFTATFAGARIFGWVAHIAEARRTGTLIRPAARWAGAEPRRRAA